MIGCKKYRKKGMCIKESLHNDCNKKQDLRCKSATQTQRKICVAEKHDRVNRQMVYLDAILMVKINSSKSIHKFGKGCYNIPRILNKVDKTVKK